MMERTRGGMWVDSNVPPITQQRVSEALRGSRRVSGVRSRFGSVGDGLDGTVIGTLLTAEEL